MNSKIWIIPYVFLFLSIFIFSTLYLFSEDNSKYVPYKVTIVILKPMHPYHSYLTQVMPSDPTMCMNELFNEFQTGNLNADTLREGIDKCLGLNSNSNGDNNSQIIPQ